MGDTKQERARLKAIDKAIGKSLAEARKAAGKSQSDVAALLEWETDGADGQGRVSHIETGRNSCKVNELVDLSAVLGTTPEDILRSALAGLPRRKVPPMKLPAAFERQLRGLTTEQAVAMLVEALRRSNRAEK